MDLEDSQEILDQARKLALMLGNKLGGPHAMEFREELGRKALIYIERQMAVIGDKYEMTDTQRVVNTTLAMQEMAEAANDALGD